MSCDIEILKQFIRALATHNAVTTGPGEFGLLIGLFESRIWTTFTVDGIDDHTSAIQMLHFAGGHDAFIFVRFDHGDEFTDTDHRRYLATTSDAFEIPMHSYWVYSLTADTFREVR